MVEIIPTSEGESPPGNLNECDLQQSDQGLKLDVFDLYTCGVVGSRSTLEMDLRFWRLNANDKELGCGVERMLGERCTGLSDQVTGFLDAEIV